MLPIRIIVASYDSGRASYRMGAGPEALLGGGLLDHLKGHQVSTTNVTSQDDAQDVLGHTLELAAYVSRAVQLAREEGAFPIVLAGNCFMSVGAVAGLGARSKAVAWFDAHGDLNTPSTSPSGFLDGMAAAVLLGWCYANEAKVIGGYSPLGENRLMLVGARALDEAEGDALATHPIKYIPVESVNGPLNWLNGSVDNGSDAAEVYVHVDLDVLDSDRVGRANAFACPGGLTAKQVLSSVERIGEDHSIAGLTISAYDPSVDESGSVRRAAVELIGGVADVARRQAFEKRPGGVPAASITPDN